MASIALPAEFQGSYIKSIRYPLNLGPHLSYGHALLNQYRERLISRKDTLFVVDKQKHKVPVRDISVAGTVSKRNILSDDDARDFLGDTFKIDPNDPSKSTGGLTKSDVRCRFIFLVTESATAPIEIDGRMLTRFLTYYQVMPQYLDFLHVYGSPHGEDRELRFSGFRTEKVLINPVPGTDVPQMGRSGRRYQLCYNLKTVRLKGEKEGEAVNKQWKIRQAAIHHQFDVGSGNQMWMIGDPHAVIKERVSELFHDQRVYDGSFATLGQSLKSSLDVHLVFCRWATSEWRWNVQSSEEIIDNLTRKLVHKREMSHIGSSDPVSLGEVQKWEDKTNETIMILESNADIMTMLRKFYNELVADENFPDKERKACQQAVQNFASQLDELVYDTKMQTARAKVLVKIVADRKTILIQHLQTQSATIAAELTASMHEQADRNAIEAIAVRIVTIVTLVYLPATFSSTFFSTDIVKYQDDGVDGERFSLLALQRFFQVTMPLMAFTFLAAGLWFWVEWTRITHRSQDMKNRYPELFSSMIGRKG